ncbi:WD40/YVTN/BNR-like repeat-containing protein [Kribbella sp. NPDC051587]|uniref:WD40/YVTN/BNR-like repeat-containing protein n=1 Tax=Kribbella sp. NPDC051587 TaxID=3364119 RepID=UPI00379E6D42
MSELKELAWAVHDSVHAPAFPSLTYRVRRRRRRRVALMVATAAVLALVIGLPISRLENTQVAAQSSYVPGDGVSYSPGSDAVGESLVADPESELSSVAVIDPDRWMSAWSRCLPSCSYSAVVKWDGVKVAMPARSMPYQILRRGDELILLAPPDRGTSDDASWSDSFLVRLTPNGPVRTALRYARPSRTFAPKSEVLVPSLTPGNIDAVNVEKSTLRRVQPPGIQFPVSPVRDDAGRWWMLDTTDGSRILRTEDGKNWQPTTLDESSGPAFLAVSRDGRTILAGARLSGFQRVTALKMSTNGGADWHPIPVSQKLSADWPVAFNDGTALLIQTGGARENQYLLRVHDGQIAPVPADKSWTSSTSSAPRSELRGDENLISGIVELWSDPAEAHPRFPWAVLVSTDQGTTWSSFVPR